ncbi:MAG: metallophosphoesterase [Tissierellia bacterium]|nr:metallophosphoesterase [Tissierellia bacterium]
MVRIIHTADLHLEKRLDSSSYPSEYAQSRRKEVWETFYNMLLFAEKENVDLFLISGDLFESEFFGLRDFYRLKSIFSKFPDLKILVITGNHDYYSNKSLYNNVVFPNNVHLFKSDKVSFKDYRKLNTRVYGISWIKEFYEDFKLPEFNLDKSYKNILMIHSDIINQSRYMHINYDELKTLGFDYIALGHIHKYTKIDDRIFYPGCPEPMDFGEDGERGFILTEIDYDIKSEFIPFSKRKFLINKIKIDKDDEEVDLINAIKALNTEVDFHRIVIEGIANENFYNKINHILESFKHDFYYLEYINNSSYLDADYMKRIESDIFIKSFIQILRDSDADQKIKDMAIDKGLKLLAGDFSEIKYR